MPVRIVRRAKAVTDAESIADWIARDSLEAALRILENLESTPDRLAVFPNSGIPFRTDIRELADLRFASVKGFPNHVVFYVERKSAIEVVRIMLGARDRKAELRRQ